MKWICIIMCKVRKIFCLVLFCGIWVAANDNIFLKNKQKIVHHVILWLSYLQPPLTERVKLFLFERYIPKVKKLWIQIFKKALVWEKNGFFWFFLLLFFMFFQGPVRQLFERVKIEKSDFFQHSLFLETICNL